MKRFLLFFSMLLGSIGMFAQPRSDKPEVEYYKTPVSSSDTGEKMPPASRYDYSEVAKQLTSGCKKDYQKIRAIYQWICDNIEYDTSYSIYTADECFDKRRGVCQAYCELFYHIAKACGVTTEIVGGQSKDSEGVVGKHAWLFAYTRDNYGMFLDPTWGAGSVNGNKFTKSSNPWLWFNVNSEWLILSHFPDDKSYQLTNVPVTLNEFNFFEPVSDLWLEYGLDVKDVSKKVRKGGFTMPKFYSCDDSGLELLNIPMRKDLDVGEFYTFRIRVGNKDFTIYSNGTYTKKDKWTDEGNGVYSIKYMVRDIPKLSLSVRNNSSDMWNTCVEYQINQPTQSNWKKVEQYYPLSIPEVKNIKNVEAECWEQAGIDNRKLLQLIRESGTKELPVLFTEEGQKLKIESVPMTRKLKTGKTYTFTFHPYSGTKWAIINGSTWYRDWNVSEDGTYSMTIVPTETGYLRLSVQFENNGSYCSCLDYEVVN